MVTLSRLIVAASLPLVLGCATSQPEPSSPVTSSPAAQPVRAGGDVIRVPGERITRAVVVVSIDGLRPAAIEASDAPALRRLLREGAWSLEAQTILPSRTLPSHVSMLTGAPVELHGVTWNDDQSERLGVVEVPTIFSIADQHGISTAGFVSKAKFRHLDQPGSFDYVQIPARGRMLSVAETVEAATRYIEGRRPELVFVHIGEPDYAGHSVGWGGRVYRWAVRRADAGLARVIAAATRAYGEDGYTLLVTSDHGGHDRDHGSDHLDDTTIPWIAWGAQVRPGRLPAGIRTMDTAATVLYLLGLPAPATVTGRPVTAAFSAEPASPAHTPDAGQP